MTEMLGCELEASEVDTIMNDFNVGEVRAYNWKSSELYTGAETLNDILLHSAMKTKAPRHTSQSDSVLLSPHLGTSFMLISH